MFLMIYSISWSNFSVWLLLLLELLENMCMIIVSLSGFVVINFEINIIFLIKPFSCMTKRSRQKFQCLQNKNNFQSEIKRFFFPFSKGSTCRKFSQTRQCNFKTKNSQQTVQLTPIFKKSWITYLFCFNLVHVGTIRTYQSRSFHQLSTSL